MSDLQNFSFFSRFKPERGCGGPTDHSSATGILVRFQENKFFVGPISEKAGKRRGKGNPLKNNTPEKNKISGTLVRLLWRAAAPGLKPLRLPRAQMEVHIHLKNAFPDRIGNRRITSGYNLWFASHPSPGLWFGKKLFFFLALFVLLPTTQRGFCEDDAFARILAELF